MLASQSLSRTIAGNELPNQKLFYRSLLEMLIVRQNIKLKNSIQVGRMKKCNNFVDYIKQCTKRTNLSLDNTSENELHDLFEARQHDGDLLNLFYLIRMTFAPILETIILLDRLLYLKEQGINQSFIVKLFDPVVSPRCYAIVAIKDC